MSDTPKVPLKINQGTTFRYKFPYQNKLGRPIDLTGFTGRMQIRPEVTSGVILASLTTENGGMILGGKAGTISLYVNDTATSAMNWLKGVYDIELQSPTGDVFRPVGGPVTVSPEVTRA